MSPFPSFGATPSLAPWNWSDGPSTRTAGCSSGSSVGWLQFIFALTHSSNTGCSSLVGEFRCSRSHRLGQERVSNSLQAGFLYILTAILMTFAVVIMKRRFGRQRPILINENRLIDLRTRETNKAFPSGDTAHSSLFAFFILLHLQSPYWVFVVPLTAFARIYYQCHWIGDTIAGTVVGLVFATISYAICDIEKGAFF